ncbi:MAG: PKD domain-containing protein [Candidatus Acetothermia bacterium]|jgi:hypothetical protein|nr:PKD domain-containing protein [Candidatus Acetothermia bacterium]MDH7505605.1 PKD domain-containing protein [Candidatus Acetothermia bacterium]
MTTARFVAIPLLALSLAALLLSGCNFWAKGPEGRVFLVTIPDQEAMTFLNRFSAGIAELHALLDPLDEPGLALLLQEVEASFRQLDRDIARASPARPVDLVGLRQRVAALTEAIEAQAARNPRLNAALAQARELQRLAEAFGLAVQAGLGPSASVDGDEAEEEVLPSSAPDGTTANATSGVSSAQAVPQGEMVAFLEQFNALIYQVSMVLNALNAPPLLRLLDEVKDSFRKVQRELESGARAASLDLSSLRQRLALLRETIAAYPCRGTRSRTVLDEKLQELERLVERFALRIQQLIGDGRPSDGGGDSAVLEARIAGGNRTVCLGDPQFSARGSTGLIVQYLWNFGDGRTGTGLTVNHEYRRPGDYTVTLTVVDRDGHTARDSILVSVRYC